MWGQIVAWLKACAESGQPPPTSPPLSRVEPDLRLAAFEHLLQQPEIAVGRFADLRRHDRRREIGQA